MKIQKTDMVVPGIVGAVGLVLLVAWMLTGSPFELQARVPGMDQSPRDGGADGAALAAPVAGDPLRGDGRPSDLTGAWPGFRGPTRDGICDDGVPLARTWPADGPPVLWSVELGDGYASPVVHQGCVYLLDYDDEAKADVMLCLSLDNGREIWRNSYPVEVAWNHGYSRTVPVVAGDGIITIGPQCHVAYWDAKSGECRWLLDLALDEGTQVPRWYTGQCPLLDGDRLILAPGGKALLMAVDYKTGEAIWRSPNPRGWEMTHVSIMPMDVDGRRTYVYCGSGGVVGVAADDGSLLWDNAEWPVQFAHAPSPLVLPGNRIFLCSGYGTKTGSLFLQVRQDEGGLVADIESRLSPRQFNSEQQTPILYRGHILGVRKRGGGQLVCMDLQGNEIWNSGRERFGHGPYLIVDGLIFVLSDRGRLVMAEASTTAFRLLGSDDVFEDGHDAWAPMTPASGRLILRDMTRMVCLDIAAD
ncbi:MAG: PQQ-binding-like beta-propeller repeat protein [Pirellulaceae bacterium]